MMTFPTARPPLPLRGNRFTQTLARAALSLAGWRIEGELPSCPKVVAIVAPHTSNWDFVVGLAAKYAMGLRVSFLGKHTLFRPPFGALFQWLGGIPVDRRSPHGVVAQCVDAFAAREALVLAVAPEGTRRSGVGWKSGFYQIAVGAGVQVFPVAFDYATRTVRLLPMFQPSGDINADLPKLLAQYATVRGKHPRIVPAPSP
jgi:1-acyl-sn-glycerol-3-phosphate acyltransferase